MLQSHEKAGLRDPLIRRRVTTLFLSVGWMIWSSAIAGALEKPSWPDIHMAASKVTDAKVANGAGKSAKSCGASSADYAPILFPQYALLVREGKLIGTIALCEFKGDPGHVSLVDAGGKKLDGTVGENTTLLGTAMPEAPVNLDDIVATADHSPPPEESPEELAKHSVAVEYVVARGPDGKFHDALIVSSPNKRLADQVIMQMPHMHFEGFTPNEGETARLFTGAVRFITPK